MLETPSYSVAVGRLCSAACCSPDSTTCADGAALSDGSLGYDRFAERQGEGPTLARSEVYVVSARYRLPQAGKR